MDQKEFLTRVLPVGNHYIAYPGDKRGPTGQIIWNHRSFTEPYQGVKLSDDTANRSKDVYFAVASFKKAKVLDARLGKEKSYRKQENVAELKCLFIDIDFKNYKSPEETVEAFKAFLLSSQLEKPTIIVRTGGGLHVYWTFPTPLPRDEWQVLANGLAGLAENLGLRADLQCTIDSARILRMPGTRNFKYDPAPLCEVVSSRADDVDMAALKRRLHGVTSMRARTGRSPKPSSIVVDPEVTGMFAGTQADDLGAGVMGESLMSAMTMGCPMLADMLARGGNGDKRDLWTNMVLLASFAPDGREYAHFMSMGDPRYTKLETDQEFDSKIAEQGKGIGPTTCDTFARSGSTHCATCPHRNKIRSPIVLGRAAVPEPEVDAPLLPTFNEGGQTKYRRLEKVDGEGWVWVPYPIFDMEIVGTPVLNVFPTNPGTAILETTLSDVGGKLYRVALDTSRMKNREYFMSQFGAQKIIIQQSVEKKVEEAMGAWVNHLRKIGAAAPGSFGWINDVAGHSGFAIAGDLYAEDGQQYRIGIAPGFDRGFGVVGSPEPWQKLAGLIIADDRVEMQIGLATAFAAPLVTFTELHATSVSLRSTMSGVGKTSVMRTARAVYGDPDFMSQANDTPTSVESTLASQTNMPWYWDELRASHLEQLPDTIYQILQGKSKGRAAPDGSAKATLRIRGMLVMASNLSVHEIMQGVSGGTDAGVYRVFEINVPPRTTLKTSTSFNEAMFALKDNYGHAGVIYAQYLATHMDEVRTVVREITRFVDENYETTQAERYWVTTVKTLLAGAVLANRANICQFDINRINERLKHIIEISRSITITGLNPADIAASIYRHFFKQLLITNDYNWKAGRGRPRPVITNKLVLEQHGHPRVRMAWADDVLAISEEAIEEYARHKRLQAANVKEQLRKISQIGNRIALDAGTATGEGSRMGRQCIYIMKASDILGADEIQKWVTGAASHPAASPGSSSATPPAGSSPP